MPIFQTADGSHSLFSEKFGVAYHSVHGALTESRHVFINAGLRHKAAIQRKISVLETGLGSGLNAFLTWLEAERRNLEIEYSGLEIYPISEAEAAELNYPELLDCSERRDDFYSLHTCPWEKRLEFSEHFAFQKSQNRIENLDFENEFDLVYFDVFSPQAQPELWEETVFQRLWKALKPEGVLVTYCAQGEFRRRLKRAGFAIEKLAGPPGKREMTRASKEG